MKNPSGTAPSSALFNSEEAHHVDDVAPPSAPPSLRPSSSLSRTERTTRPSFWPALTASMRNQRKLATALYLLTTSLLFADQNLLSPNLSAIAAEFRLDDIERDKKLGGDIAVAFWMVGLPASFLVGCLADVMENRSLLFLIVILIGEGACLGTYFITTYRQLYWCRAMTGFSVGGALPLIYSVLGDYYEPRERGWVSGAISMGCGIGISIGQIVAGMLGPSFGWRVPFLVVSVPAMVCSLAVWLCIPEVERGAGEKQSLIREGLPRLGNDEGLDDKQAEVEMAETMGDEGSEDAKGTNPCKLRRTVTSKATLVDPDSPKQGMYIQLNNQESSCSNSLCSAQSSTNYMFFGHLSKYYHKSIHPHMQTLKTLLRCPSVLLAIFQGSPGCIPWGIINTYLNDYLSSDRGLSVGGATLVMTVFGIGNFMGTLLGGVGSSFLYAQGPRYTAILSSGAAIAGCFPLWGLVNFNFDSNMNEDSDHNSNGDPNNHYIVLGSMSILAGLLSGVTGPIVKSTLQNVTMPQMRGQAFALLNTFDDFGRGLGPAFVAWMIEELGGRRKAFNVGICGWLFCGIFNGLMFFTVETDEKKVRLGIEQMVAEVDEISNDASTSRNDHDPRG